MFWVFSTVPIIDANVERVIGRFFDLQWPIRDALTRRKMQKLVGQLLPLKRFQEYNYGLIDFAALVCRHQRLLRYLLPLQTAPILDD